jgi:hypothetical protein
MQPHDMPLQARSKSCSLHCNYPVHLLTVSQFCYQCLAAWKTCSCPIITASPIRKQNPCRPLRTGIAVRRVIACRNEKLQTAKCEHRQFVKRVYQSQRFCDLCDVTQSTMRCKDCNIFACGQCTGDDSGACQRAT